MVSKYMVSAVVSFFEKSLMKKNLLAAPENVDTISHIFLSFWHTQRVVQLVYFPTNICCFYLNQLTNHWFRHIDNLR